MLAGLESVSSGEIRIDGDDVSQRAPKDRDIAMVFQSYALYPHMTVAQNMEYGLKLRGMPKGERAAKVNDSLQARLGTTTLYVTHDQVEAMTMGHRVAVRAAEAHLFDRTTGLRLG
jgi:ABC-type sugar transport system ATPase subunit